MKQIFLLLFLICSYVVYGQDLIVTVSGDSLKCKIVEMNPEDIQFRFGMGRVISIDRIDVASFQYNFEPVDTSDKRPVHEEKIKPGAEQLPVIKYGMLDAQGKHVFQGGRELKKEDIRKLMADNDALRLYNKGISSNRNGTILLFTGIGLAGGGVFTLIAKPFEQKKSYVGQLDGNNYFKYDDKLNNIISYALIGTGAVSTIAGISMKISSKTSIKKSVEKYNREKAESNMELRFDVYGNGASLALKF